MPVLISSCTPGGSFLGRIQLPVLGHKDFFAVAWMAGRAAGFIPVGRIVTNVRVRNLLEEGFSISCDALVDTGAAYLVLPAAWKDRLGGLNTVRRIDCETATQDLVSAEVCGPVEILLEGFAPVYGEVLFLEMHPQDGQYEPLVGYIVLEQCQAAVDLLGHRLVHVKKTDLK